MAFILSPQLDNGGDPNLPFQLYESYIQDNHGRFPTSVLSLLENQKWRDGGSDSPSPHRSVLEHFELGNLGTTDARLKLVLSKGIYLPRPIRIDVEYVGLLRIDLPEVDSLNERPMVWRYNQFLWFNPRRSHGIDQNMFIHQIEWVDEVVWSITAREVSVAWNDA